MQTISFFGGEPLLNFKTIKAFVQYLYENTINIPNLAIASNGTIMNKEIKEFLNKYNIHFCTSLDGPKMLNDLSRVGSGIESVYDKVVGTLKALSDSKIQKGVQITVNRSHIYGYSKGDIKRWLKDLETLEIDTYEMVPVTSEDNRYEIDLDDPDIYERFVQLCIDYVEYSLEILKSKDIPKAISRLVPGLMLHIIQRVYRTDCSAGFSFCVSPDKIGYPRHVCADERKYGEIFNEDFRNNIVKNSDFQKVKLVEKGLLKKCNKCVAKTVCSYICKGLSAQNNFDLPEARCVMMKTALRKVVIFLAEEYKDNKEQVRKNLAYINLNRKNV